MAFLVFVVFGGVSGDAFSEDSVTLWQKVIDYQLLWGALVLLISHGVSWFRNYIGTKEYRRIKVGELMQQPYGRVVILHLTIIFGGFLVMLLGSPVIGLLFLVVLKTVIDVRAHLREHDKYAPQKAAST